MENYNTEIIRNGVRILKTMILQGRFNESVLPPDWHLENIVKKILEECK